MGLGTRRMPRVARPRAWAQSTPADSGGSLRIRRGPGQTTGSLSGITLQCENSFLIHAASYLTFLLKGRT